jgi:hypothetical protein
MVLACVATLGASAVIAAPASDGTAGGHDTAAAVSDAGRCGGLDG